LEFSEATKKEMGKRQLLNPGDFGAVHQVIQDDLREGHLHAAQEKVLSTLKIKDAPAYFHYLEALIYEGMDEWEKACRAILRYDSLRAGAAK
jgi:hypothetical protein